MLETVQREKGKTAFNKYLPHVMKDARKSSIISESKTETTGDRSKATPQAKQTDEDVINIRKLAGIK